MENFVYVVLYGAQYEGTELLGVFTDYVKARAFEVQYQAKHMIGTDTEWVEIRKVELNKVYDVMQSVGEEV